MVVKIILYLINIDKNGTEISIPFPPLKAMPGQSPGRKRTTNKASCHDIDAKRREAEKLSPRPRHLLLLWILSRFGHQLGFHKPAALLHPEVGFLAVDHADIPIPYAAHLGSAAANVLDFVDLVHLPRSKADHQRPQVAARFKADINSQLPLFACNDLP